MLKVDNFAWDKNEFSSKFRGCKGTAAFIQIFNEALRINAPQSPVIDGTSPPASKRQKITPLVPASHSARCSEAQDDDDFDICKVNFIH